MKTVLVTGSNGLLGQKITEKIVNEGGYHLIATSKGTNRFLTNKGYVYEEMDITDREKMRDVVVKYRPDAIIHTAAITNVDTCHVERKLAHQLNVESLVNLISLCEEFDIQLIHLSTDFVFDGANGPYNETSATSPVSYYGETKVLGEELLKNANIKWCVIRTILVYGILKDMSRSNIVLWAKAALEKAEPIKVVNDQWRMPTLAEDLADACLMAVEKEAQGIYHISGKDMLSVVEIVRSVAKYWQLDQSKIVEVSSKSLNQDAKRPAKTGFILDKAMTDLNYQPHSFDEGLAILDQQLKTHN